MKFTTDKWPAIRGGIAGRLRGANFKRPAKHENPYASGTHRIVPDRYLKILKMLEEDIRDEAGPMNMVVMGHLMDLSAAAARITCGHLEDYLTKNGLEPRKILQRTLIRGIGICWEGKRDIEAGIYLIKQHIKQAR